MCLDPKTLRIMRIFAQNATKTSVGNILESLSNLFLRDNCRLLQRLLNNAKPCAAVLFDNDFWVAWFFSVFAESTNCTVKGVS